MEWYLLALIIFLGLFLLIFSGMPVGFSLAIAGFAGYLYLAGWKASLAMLGSVFYSSACTPVFAALPVFIFMAEIILFTGIGTDLYEASHSLFGNLRAGLAMSSIAACAGFSAVCGTSTGTTTTIGLISIPEMQSRGYSDRLTAGVLAASGGLGILIPPSLPLILYGIITETSIGKLFMAGIIPGIILAGLYMAYVGLIAAKGNASAAQEGVPRRKRILALGKTWPVLILAVVMLGGIYGGIFTPTEAGGIGAFSTLCLAAIHRQLNWRNLKTAMLRAGQNTAMLCIVIIGALMFGYMLTAAQIPQRLAAFLVSLVMPGWAVIIGVNVLLLLLGCILEVGSLMLIVLPIIFPLVQALGYDPVWFGVMFCVNMEMALITPPVGMNLYVIKGISNISFGDIVRGAFPFMLLQVVTLFIIIVCPQVTVFLPSRMYSGFGG